VTLVAGYHDHPAYVGALAASVRAHWEAHGRGERLLVSFHGLPVSQVAAGDRYPERCARTAALLAERPTACSPSGRAPACARRT